MQLSEAQLANIIAAVSMDANNEPQEVEVRDEDVMKFHTSQNCLDVNTSVFFLRELEHIQREVKATKQQKLKGMMLIPVSTDAPSWAKTITYRTLTRVGRAKVVADYVHDFPRADYYMNEYSIAVKDIGSSYGYSKDEIQAGIQTGQRLDRERATSCKRAIDEEQDEIIWLGDEVSGLQGFIDYPGITEYTIPDGQGGDPEWNTKTGQEIYDDLVGIVTAVIDTTNGVEAPDTLLLPIAQFMLASNKLLNDSSDKTVLGAFLEYNGIIKNVDWLNELSGAGAGGSDRMMIYTNSPAYVRTEIPMLYQEEAPQQKGLEFEVIARQKTAGVLMYYPLSAAYADNI